MVKVAFVGAHSTGKTTLLEYCKRQLGKDLTVIEDVARQVIARGFPLGEYATVDSFVNYVRDQFRAEKLSLNGNYRTLISNRTVLDSAAYAYVNRSLPRPYVADYFIEMLEEIACREAQYYDLFVNFAISFPLVTDGIRPANEQYRGDVAKRISELLQISGMPYIEVAGSTETRYGQLMRAVAAIDKSRT